MLSSLSRLANLAKFSSLAPKHPYQHLFPRVVEGLGNDLRNIENFEERLLPSIAYACNYLDEQILSIPGGLEISERSFYQMDIASRLFGEPADIGAALGKSLDVKSALPGLIQAGNDSVCALLGMRARREPDIRSVAPVFTDHTLAALAPTEDDLRRFLRNIVFGRFISNCAAFPDGMPQADFRSTSNRSSEDKLNALINLLNTPERLFRLEASGFSIPVESCQPVELPLLYSSDRRQWIVSIVRFNTQEAFAAQEREPKKHRYIYL